MTRDIAIDGPSGSGKSTVGMSVAQRLCMPLIDSGLLYRVFTAAYLAAYPGDREINYEHLTKILKGVIVRNMEGSFLYEGSEAPLPLHDLRVDELVSPVSAVPAVRRAVNRELRSIAATQDVVMVGRDIGTAVLPQAFLKIFIDAPPEIRARRRTIQLSHHGMPADYDVVLANLLARDVLDSTREDSPLLCDSTYIWLDNSRDGSEAIVNRILEEYRRRITHAI